MASDNASDPSREGEPLVTVDQATCLAVVPGGAKDESLVSPAGDAVSLPEPTAPFLERSGRPGVSDLAPEGVIEAAVATLAGTDGAAVPADAAEAESVPTVPDADVILCPECGQGVTAESKYCGHCGKDLLAWPADDDTRCSRCLALRTVESRFCATCGADFEQVEGEAGHSAVEIEHDGYPRKAPLWRRALLTFLSGIVWLVAIAATLAVVAGATSAAVWFFGYAQAVDVYTASVAPVLVETQLLDQEMTVVTRTVSAAEIEDVRALIEAADRDLARLGEQMTLSSMIPCPAFVVPVAVSLTQALQFRQDAVINHRSYLTAQLQASEASLNAAYYRQMGEWYYSDYLWIGANRNGILDQYRYALEKEKAAIELAQRWQQAAGIHEERRVKAQEAFEAHLAYSQAEIERLQRRPRTFEEFVNQVRIVLGV